MILRRLLVAVLALAIAAPTVVQAKSPCGMDAAAMSAGPCDCCDSPDATPCHDDEAAATTGTACGCSLQRDDGDHDETTLPSTTSFEPPAPVAVLLPVERSAPRRALHPPREDAVPTARPPSRPALCVWTI